MASYQILLVPHSKIHGCKIYLLQISLSKQVVLEPKKRATGTRCKMDMDPNCLLELCCKITFSLSSPTSFPLLKDRLLHSNLLVSTSTLVGSKILDNRIQQYICKSKGCQLVTTTQQRTKLSHKTHDCLWYNRKGRRIHPYARKRRFGSVVITSCRRKWIWLLSQLACWRISQ